MRLLLQEVRSGHTPESLAAQFSAESGLVLLSSGGLNPTYARYSLVAARPFLSMRSWGTRIETQTQGSRQIQFGDPWRILDCLMARYELLEQVDLPFPLGGCFGYWGYDLNAFLEPRLRRTAVHDLELPDCCVGFYDSLVVFDHALNKTWVVSTGLQADGSRDEARARTRAEFWRQKLSAEHSEENPRPEDASQPSDALVNSNVTRTGFIDMVNRAQRYITAGDIYQVNLAQRLTSPVRTNSYDFFRALASRSPAPFAAYLNCGGYQVVSSSPECFLRLNGSSIQTRPIKGTRPRHADPNRDTQLAFELRTSPKETAEIVMITDLLRNDLGRVCEYGSIHVPELARLERFAQVQHLVSTVEGHLRSDVSHLRALAQCFPGGSVTGAPKIRAMEIIDELEPIARGPYTGCIGYLGFNRESQFSIVIRSAICTERQLWFHVGAGIVADSDPAAEYNETWAKAAGLIAALGPSSLISAV